MAGPNMLPGWTEMQFTALTVFIFWSSEDLRRKGEKRFIYLDSTFPYLALRALASSQVTQGFQLPTAQPGASRGGGAGTWRECV